MSGLSSVVVGLGHIGLGFDLDSQGDTVFTHTEACRQHPDVDLVGGVDIDSQVRDRFAARAGVPAFSSLGECRARYPQVDLVIISTPTGVREEVVQECIDFSPRAILLDKPLAASVEEGKRIVRMCNEHAIPLAVNYIRRFDPAIMKLPELASARHFGELQLVLVYYSGGLLANASHYVDLLTAWYGLPTRAEPMGEPTGHDDNRVSFVLKYRNLDAFFHSVDAAYGIGEMDLLFKDGRVRLKDYGEALELFGSGPDPFFADYQRLTPLNADALQPEMCRYQYHVLEAMVQTIRGGAPLPSTGESALAVLSLCESLGRS